MARPLIRNQQQPPQQPDFPFLISHSLSSLGRTGRTERSRNESANFTRRTNSFSVKVSAHASPFPASRRPADTLLSPVAFLTFDFAGRFERKQNGESSRGIEEVVWIWAPPFLIFIYWRSYFEEMFARVTARISLTCLFYTVELFMKRNDLCCEFWRLKERYESSLLKTRSLNVGHFRISWEKETQRQYVFKNYF